MADYEHDKCYNLCVVHATISTAIWYLLPGPFFLHALVF